jgi:hypothetical protein
MDSTKMFIGAVVVIGALVAIWWFGWFAPATNALKAVKNNSVQQRR